MAVPTVVLLIPKFLVINQIGIYNTYTGLIVPLLADAAGVFIMKNFFESIPVSIEEQARIDGAGTFRIFWSVVLPMARPALITIIILSFQGSWNELAHFIVAAQDPALTTLTKGVAQLSSGQLSQGSQYPLKLAAGAIMTIPVAIVFFIFQRRILNATAGAVKRVSPRSRPRRSIRAARRRPRARGSRRRSATAERHRPIMTSWIVSTLKVLKVVRPPAKPLSRMSRRSCADHPGLHEAEHDPADERADHVDDEDRPREPGRRPGEGERGGVAEQRAQRAGRECRHDDQGAHSSSPIGSGSAAEEQPSRAAPRPAASETSR